MGKQRQSQHRPEREAVRGRELAEARKEVKQLKRMVSRLQKTIRKFEEQRGTPLDLEEASPEPTLSGVDLKKDPEACKCGANSWTCFTTPGGKTIKACKVCKTRR